MNEKDLKRLIEKFYDGISTDEDEKVLRAFFSGNDVPAGYEAEKETFGHYNDSVEIPEPSADFEARIRSAIDDPSAGRGYGKIRKLILPLISAAAGFLLIVGSYFLITHKSGTEDTYSDPRIAYAETMKILFDVSAQLNRGTRSLQPVGKINEIKVRGFKSINKSAVLIEKNLRSLGYLKNSGEKNDTLNER